MKKTKILGFIIGILFAILLFSNKSYAMTPDDLIYAANTDFNMAKTYKNQDIYIDFGMVKKSSFLYCVEHNAKMRTGKYNDYKIVEYISIEGNKATNADGIVVENDLNSTMAAILANPLYAKGYGPLAKAYTRTQYAIYNYWYTWINSLAGSGMNVDGFIKDNGVVRGAISLATIQQWMATAPANRTFRGKIYFLKCTAYDYQTLICATGDFIDEVPQPSENGLKIDKIDGDSQKSLSKVSFIIKNATTGKYIKKEDITIGTSSSPNRTTYIYKDSSQSSGGSQGGSSESGGSSGSSSSSGGYVSIKDVETVNFPGLESNAYYKGYQYKGDHGIEVCYEQWSSSESTQKATGSGLKGFKIFIKSCHGTDMFTDKEIDDFWATGSNSIDDIFEEWKDSLTKKSEVSEERFRYFVQENYEISDKELDAWLAGAKADGRFNINKIIGDAGLEDGDLYGDSMESWYDDDWYQDGPFMMPTRNAILKWAKEEFEGELDDLDDAYEKADENNQQLDREQYLVNEKGITENAFVSRMLDVVRVRKEEDLGEELASSLEYETSERIRECYKAFLQGKSFGGTTNYTEYEDTSTDDFNQAINEGAYIFTTGVSTYSSIFIQGLPTGTYQIIEVKNLNDGYEDLNVGTTVTTMYTTGTSSSITITNYKEDDETHDDYGDASGKVTISGTVWEDLLNGKDNEINSTRDSGEKGLAGVKVYWKNGNTIIESTTTNSSGNYSMTTDISVTSGSCLLGNPIYSLDTARYEFLNNSHIEFEYNGLKYTTVENVSSQEANKSQGVEIPQSRLALDNSFDEVNSQGVINNGSVYQRIGANGGSTPSYTLSGDNSNSLRTATLNQSNSEFGVRASTKLAGVNSLMDTASTKTARFHKRDRHWHTRRRNGGSRCHRSCTKQSRINKWTITNLNLGLYQREQPDLAITSDIEQVKVVMKNQAYIYDYNHRNIGSVNSSADFKVSFEKKRNPGVYTRPVNPSDIAYMNQNDDGKVQVYVTYNVKVVNQSTTLPVKVKEIVNYYDDDYTLVSTSDWSTKSKYGQTYNQNGYKAAYTTKLTNQVIAPQGVSSIVKIEFEVNERTVKGLINQQDVLIRNVSEINGYSTLYGSNTKCAEYKTADELGKTNAQYAGVDIDSVPGNTTPGNGATYEDDTDEAPIFKLNVNRDNKFVSGTIWEDTQTTDSKNKNERVGNGVKDNNENNVKNAKIELLRADSNGNIRKDGSGNEVKADLYTIENGRAVTKSAVTYSDDSGHYSFEGIVTDYYVLKYTYGDDTSVLSNGPTMINGNVINARNYKSTIVTVDPVKSAVDGNRNDKWHLTLRDNASIAVDDLDNRLSISSLQYNNFNTPVNVTSYSPSFRMQVEYDATGRQESRVDEDGGDFENDSGIFDFGIIERAREDIVIDKTIENLKITLANGQILTEGNPYSSNMNYVKALGNTMTTRENVVNNKKQTKLLYLEMDSELIQGSRIDILYKITATNNSEIDYEYDRANGGNERYYYFGQVSSPKIKPSVELVVDYVDNELTVDLDNQNNKNWKQVQAEELKDQGLISEATYNTIKKTASNYLIYTTEIFKDIAAGESHSEYLFATKLLANQANDYTYENHVEILKLNGKIARNIDSTESSGKQVTKTYKPGTYVPSLTRTAATYVKGTDVRNKDRYLTDGTLETVGLHTQDDDTITVRITPPTGTTDNTITYIITGVIAFVIIGIGIYIIKKKVL